MSRIFRFLIPLAAVAAFLWFCPPARLLALAVVGRSPECPIADAIMADQNLKLQIRYNDEIFKASKLLETDAGGFEHWDTPAGQYWIPKGSRYGPCAEANHAARPDVMYFH